MNKKRVSRILYQRRHHVRKRSKSAIFRMRIFKLSFLLFVFFIGTSAVICFSDVFKVADIIVHANDDLDAPDSHLATDIKKSIESFLVLAPFPVKHNILFINESKLKSKILEKFPEVSYITIKKQRKNRLLDVIYEERIAEAIWCNVRLALSNGEDDGKNPSYDGNGDGDAQKEGTESQTKENLAIYYDCYYIDSGGVIFKEAPKPRGSLITSIKDYKNYPSIALGARPVSEEEMEFIVETKNAVKGALPGIGITEILYESGEITFLIDSGWKLYINSDYSPEKNAAVVRELLEDLGDIDVVSEYIDLRVKNKVYYK